jgi:hypothetical protein
VAHTGKYWDGGTHGRNPHSSNNDWASCNDQYRAWHDMGSAWTPFAESGHATCTVMRSEHHSGIATALVLLVLLAILFWDKISAMFSGSNGSVMTATVAGVPVTQPTAKDALTLPMLPPDNVPVILPYTPGPIPDISMAGWGSDIFTAHPVSIVANIKRTPTNRLRLTA